MKILVVDDDPETRDVQVAFLKRFFPTFIIMQAENGEEALQLVRKGQSVDLFIVDWHMPGMDGIVLAGRLETIIPAAKVILLSGSFLPEDAVRYLGGNIVGVFGKPVDWKTFSSFIGERKCEHVAG